MALKSVRWLSYLLGEGFYSCVCMQACFLLKHTITLTWILLMGVMEAMRVLKDSDVPRGSRNLWEDRRWGLQPPVSVWASKCKRIVFPEVEWVMHACCTTHIMVNPLPSSRRYEEGRRNDPRETPCTERLSPSTGKHGYFRALSTCPPREGQSSRVWRSGRVPPGPEGSQGLPASPANSWAWLCHSLERGPPWGKATFPWPGAGGGVASTG